MLDGLPFTAVFFKTPNNTVPGIFMKFCVCIMIAMKTSGLERALLFPLSLNFIGKELKKDLTVLVPHCLSQSCVFNLCV